MTQTVSRQLLTAVAKVQSQVSPCDMCGWLRCTGTVFSPSTLVFPCHHVTKRGPYSSSSTRSSYQKNKRAKPGDLSKATLFGKSESWVENYFHFFFFVFRRIKLAQKSTTLAWGDTEHLRLHMYQFHKYINYLPKRKSFYDIIRHVGSDSEEI
jgi:hypothetical protein